MAVDRAALAPCRTHVDDPFDAIIAVVRRRSPNPAAAGFPPPSWYGHLVELGWAERALAAAAREPRASQRVRARISISAALGSAGQRQQAAAAARSAWPDACDIADPWPRAEGQAEACAALAGTAGFDEALENAQRITEGGARIPALSAIARAAGAGGRLDQAAAIARLAVTGAEAVTFPGRRPDARAAAVAALAAAGLGEEGYELAGQIADPWARSEAFVSVATGGPGTGRAAASAALAAACSVGNSAWRAEALAAVTQTWCELGDLTRALEVAEAITDPVWRAQALVAVAGCPLTDGQTAKALLNRGTRLSWSVGYRWWQADGLAAVLARLLQETAEDSLPRGYAEIPSVLVRTARVLASGRSGRAPALQAVLGALVGADLSDLLVVDLLSSCARTYPEFTTALGELAAEADASWRAGRVAA